MNVSLTASSTRRVVVTAMLSAVAYVVMVAIHLNIVPAAPFLTYDPKDVIIALGGFIYGPAEVVIISVVVSFLEMISVSDTGIIGFVMQVIATLSYAGVAALIYKRLHTKGGALISLCVGTVSMAVIMVLWNLILSPIYLGTDRATVVALLVPAIIPFNVLKGVINSVLIMLIYKPIVTALRRTGFVA
ncbi:MAG TPA: ECF transporter S component [Candidatus Avilachnospira avistercoris]|nr:ECF transporter S component [Candidatus Avilachnospira avistercoris]